MAANRLTTPIQASLLWLGSLPIDAKDADLTIGMPGERGAHIRLKRKAMDEWLRLLGGEVYPAVICNTVHRVLRSCLSLEEWSREMREQLGRVTVRVSKRLWLEQLTWNEVTGWLEQEPKLLGYGFQKNELAVGRQLLAASPEHTFLSRYFLGNVDKCYRVHPWCDLGWCEGVSIAWK